MSRDNFEGVEVKRDGNGGYIVEGFPVKREANGLWYIRQGDGSVLRRAQTLQAAREWIKRTGGTE